MKVSARAEVVGAYYRASASTLAQSYGSVAFEDVQAPFLVDLPAPGSAILDVGAGTGRDALALARLGYDVTAAEPCGAMRQVGERLDRAGAVRWIDDRLPAMTQTLALKGRFDFILCSGVVMHLPSSEVSHVFQTLDGLLERGGRLAISLRQGPPPGEPIFHNHSDAALVTSARLAGLALRRHTVTPDILGRSGVFWRYCTFVRAQDAAPPFRFQ